MTALLSADELMTILGAHVATRMPSRLPQPMPWYCSCDTVGVAASMEGFIVAARRHVAEVLAAAIELARRTVHVNSLGADELAEQYYDRAGRILNLLGLEGCGTRGPVEHFWHVDTDLILTMLNAGRMTVVTTGTYELHGVPVRGHETAGDLDDDAPVFELVIS